MSLDYFLFCRKKYDSIIKELEYIISMYQDICDNTTNEYQDNTFFNNLITQFDFELCNPELNKNMFFEKKLNMEKIRELCNKKILSLCEHCFITDNIDITPERSETIYYCSICEYTVHLKSRL
jgi:DNA replicative helicase MCM subunit Mcm2 (Cdc46/Mcm family)